MTAASVNVLFFASLRDVVPTAPLQLELDDDATLATLRTHLQDLLDADQYDRVTAEDIRIAVNQSLIASEEDVRLHDGDEVAFMPPITGG